MPWRRINRGQDLSKYLAFTNVYKQMSMSLTLYGLLSLNTKCNIPRLPSNVWDTINNLRINSAEKLEPYTTDQDPCFYQIEPGPLLLTPLLLQNSMLRTCNQYETNRTNSLIMLSTTTSIYHSVAINRHRCCNMIGQLPFFNHVI